MNSDNQFSNWNAISIFALSGLIALSIHSGNFWAIILSSFASFVFIVYSLFIIIREQMKEQLKCIPFLICLIAALISLVISLKTVGNKSNTSIINNQKENHQDSKKLISKDKVPESLISTFDIFKRDIYNVNKIIENNKDKKDHEIDLLILQYALDETIPDNEIKIESIIDIHLIPFNGQEIFTFDIKKSFINERMLNSIRSSLICSELKEHIQAFKEQLDLYSDHKIISDLKDYIEYGYAGLGPKKYSLNYSFKTIEDVRDYKRRGFKSYYFFNDLREYRYNEFLQELYHWKISTK